MQDETHTYPPDSITISPAEIVETYKMRAKALGLRKAQEDFAEADRHMCCYAWWGEHVRPYVYGFFMDFGAEQQEQQLELARASAPKIYNMMPPQQPPAATAPPRQQLRKAGEGDGKAIRQALAMLLQAPYTKKDGQQEMLFNRKAHWQAVYRTLADKNYYRASDFEGFDSFIRPLIPEECINGRNGYSYESVKQISQTDFDCAVDDWKFDSLTSVRRKPHDRMKEVALYFRHCLEECGIR